MSCPMPSYVPILDWKSQVHFHPSGLLKEILLRYCWFLHWSMTFDLLSSCSQVQACRKENSWIHPYTQQQKKTAQQWWSCCWTSVQTSMPETQSVRDRLKWHRQAVKQKVSYCCTKVPEPHRTIHACVKCTRTQLMYCFACLLQRHRGCWASCVVSASGTVSAVTDSIFLTISPCPPDSADSCCTNDRKNKGYAELGQGQQIDAQLGWANVN